MIIVDRITSHPLWARFQGTTPAADIHPLTLVALLLALAFIVAQLAWAWALVLAPGVIFTLLAQSAITQVRRWRANRRTDEPVTVG